MSLAPVEEFSESSIRWISLLGPAAQIAERVAGTEFVSTAMRGKPDVVLAAILYGDEIGIGPMQALQSIHVVEGRPAPSAELMRAMILRAGHSLDVHEASGTRVRVSGLRRGDPESTRLVIEWTIDMARAAGLVGRQNWQRYPRAMLLARATSDLARMKFPDVIKGLGYAAEETATDLDSWSAPEILVEEPEKPARKRVSRRQKPAPVLVGPEAPRHDERPPVAPESFDPWTPTPEPVGSPPSAPAPAPVRESNEPPAQELREPPPAPTQASTTRVADEDTPLLPELQPEPDPAAGDSPTASLIGQGMLRGLHASLGRVLGQPEDRDLKLQLVSAIVNREISSTSQLTRHEGMGVVSFLLDIENGAAGWRVLDDGRIVVEHYRDQEPPDEPH